jgi:hypothetical protein
LDWEAGQQCPASFVICYSSGRAGIVRFAAVRRFVQGGKRDSVAANDQILNFLGVEDGQEFFEVVEYRVPVPSFGKPPR